MSALLRSLLALSVTSLLVIGCGNKEETAPVETTPTPAAPVAAPPAPKAPEPGGYVPTAEERVPGITIDPATLAAEAAAANGEVVSTPAAEAAPAAQ